MDLEMYTRSENFSGFFFDFLLPAAVAVLYIGKTTVVYNITVDWNLRDQQSSIVVIGTRSQI